MHITRRLVLAAYAVSILTPLSAVAQPAGVPYQQDFVLTAYYSPLPDQCCYVKGSYEADKVLNGQGTHGADGTPVYEGMIAAPPSYAFGTRIDLPGLGVYTVHDRGGAIQEWDDAHRLDIWVGAGEEGLARALAFGVQRVRGIVYPAGSDAPAESARVSTLPAPESYLKRYIVAEAGMADLHPRFGQRGLSVSLLQEGLAELGYFDHAVTGMYGDVTKNALAAFLADMKLEEPADELTERAAAYLQAARALRDAPSPVAFVSVESSASEIKAAQRLLRHLGHYRGRTDGRYTDALFQAILAYQQSQGLVGDAVSPGAGRIGPLTKGRLDREMYRRRVAREANKILAYNQIRDALEQAGALVASTMQQGVNGSQVRTLQRVLAQKGFFPANMINGNFGPLTAKAVLDFQLARELLASASDKGAGTVGPITLRMLRDEQVRAAYRVVRANGWGAL